MPDKPRKSGPVQLNPRPQCSGPISCSGQEEDLSGKPVSAEKRSDMSVTGGENDNSDLTFRQQAALPVIAFSPSIAQAARDSGIGESTLRRWLADPAFSQHLDRMRLDTAQLARQEILGLMPLCASVFADAMRSPDPSLRLRAARYALSFIIRVSELEKLNADIQDLEATSHLP